MNTRDAEKLEDAYGYAERPSKRKRGWKGAKSAYFVKTSCKNKRSYHSEDQAKAARTHIENKIRENGQVVDSTRIYHCGVCGNFHMSSVG